MVDVNRLSINFSKANFMSIKSPKKKDDQVNIDIEIVYDTIYALQRKYLGVLLDETMFLNTLFHTCVKVTGNNVFKSKLRRYLILPQVKQIYYMAQYTHIFSMQY